MRNALLGIALAIPALAGCSHAVVSRPIFGNPISELQLDFPTNNQQRRTLPGGQEVLIINGAISNLGTGSLAVPTLRVIMRDAQERVVYQFDIEPPQPSLAHGEILPVNRVVADVPTSARFLEIGWKPD